MSNSVAAQTKTVVIEWVEESRHQVTVRVPLDFDAEDCDLPDGLADLSDDGFVGLERSQITVTDAAAADPSAEFVDPPRHDTRGV